ncbi:alpha/beta hydrolase fold domain-containing protein [Lysinibacillus sp. LZ02]|uniref:alpha/beta hydrolase n=1 Tax=Lysinibacillus sp. LZ02 TaxID=3420668 RepID=UPI003D36CB5D
MTYVKEKAKRYLTNFNRLPSLTTMTPQRARALRAALPPATVKTGTVATIEDRTITARDGANIPIRIYTPKGDGPFPIIIYYHGGGWVLNDLSTCHASCTLLAEKTKSIVVSVEYRLAPEFKFPIPLHDAYDAFTWVKSEVTQLQGNGVIAVAGDSAGGNLATCVALLAKEQHLSIDAQILLYPVTNLSYESDSYETYATGFGLDRDVMKWFGQYYIRTEADAKNPLIAPLHGKLAGLPPTFLLVAENDVLRDEGLLYGKKLAQSGVVVQQSIASGLVHSFFTKNDVFEEEIDGTIEEIVSFLETYVY